MFKSKKSFSGCFVRYDNVFNYAFTQKSDFTVIVKILSKYEKLAKIDKFLANTAIYCI